MASFVVDDGTGVEVAVGVDVPPVATAEGRTQGLLDDIA